MRRWPSTYSNSPVPRQITFAHSGPRTVAQVSSLSTVTRPANRGDGSRRNDRMCHAQPPLAPVRTKGRHARRKGQTPTDGALGPWPAHATIARSPSRDVQPRSHPGPNRGAPQRKPAARQVRVAGASSKGTFSPLPRPLTLALDRAALLSPSSRQFVHDRGSLVPPRLRRGCRS